MIENYMVGTDAEVAVLLADGTPFPVTGLVRGTKATPAKLGRLGEGYAVQQDGVNLEFNVPPCDNAFSFNKVINRAVEEVTKLLPPTFTLAWGRGSHVYKREFLKHPEVMRFGCDPDSNIWTMEENVVPDGQSTELRSSAAHIHVGWDEPTNKERAALVKALDLFLGYKFVRIEDYERKKLYGKAGSFRSKPYGIEYRVLGNCWLPTYTHEVWRGVDDAINFVNIGGVIPPEIAPKLQHVINTGLHNDEVFSYCRYQLGIVQVV